MSGREFLDTSSDEWYDARPAGEHFRGTVATGRMSEEEARELEAQFDAARKPGIISRVVNWMTGALGLRQESRNSVGSGRPSIGDKMPDGTVYAGISPETHRPMYTTPEDAPLTYTFNQARDYAKQLNAAKHLGHKDWRVPTKGELNVLFNNRAAIGGFNVSGSYPAGWYWSSSEDYFNYSARAQSFSDGTQYWNFEKFDSSLRCVRG